jgi:hypothetical protein
MNPNPSPIPDCHLQFVGATVGLLKAVVRVAVRKPTRAQWSLVPAALPLTFAGPSQHEARRNCQTLLLRIARAGSKLRRDRGRPGLAGASALSMREKIVGATGIEPVTPAILPLPPSPNSNKNLSQLPILTKTHRFQEASVASSVPTLTRLQ